MPEHEVEDADAEVVRLRAQVQELQRQLVEQAARANAAVAAAEDRVYWLDRWHVDLNALMKRRGADEFRMLLRAARRVVLVLRRVRRALPV